MTCAYVLSVLYVSASDENVQQSRNTYMNISPSFRIFFFSVISFRIMTYVFTDCVYNAGKIKTRNVKKITVVIASYSRNDHSNNCLSGRKQVSPDSFRRKTVSDKIHRNGDSAHIAYTSKLMSCRVHSEGYIEHQAITEMFLTLALVGGVRACMCGCVDNAKSQIVLFLLNLK